MVGTVAASLVEGGGVCLGGKNVEHHFEAAAFASPPFDMPKQSPSDATAFCLGSNDEDIHVRAWVPGEVVLLGMDRDESEPVAPRGRDEYRGSRN